MTKNNCNYFDYAAATPVSKAVLFAMEPYFSDKFFNPSAQYLSALEVHKDIEKARADVALCLGAKPSEIIFTAGGTEANNLAISGTKNNVEGGLILTSSVEHDSILEPIAKVGHIIAPVKNDGRIDVDQLFNLINDKVYLISVMYANNEIGTVQPINEISKRIKLINNDRNKRGCIVPLWLHIDACQAPNYLHLLVNTLGVDLMTLNGGKIYGPKQSGALYVRNGVQVEPIIVGGGQERNKRSGTENVAGIIGFATALKRATKNRESESKRLLKLQKMAFSWFENNIPEAIINGSKDYRLPNNLHITIPGQDNERLMMQLDEKGYQVAVGSACSASSDEPSHVLKAIGLSDKDARSSLRITMGRETNEPSLLSLLSEIKKLVK